MQTIERRIAALEQANPPADEMTLIRRFVSPGHLHAETYRLRADDGQIWERLPGETEQAFTERASKEVKRNEWGIGCLSTDD